MSDRGRRLLAIAGAVVAGVAIGLGVTRLVSLEDALREVTLPLRHDDIIRHEAADKNVPADMIAALIYTESRFRDQTSEAGARGLMQITPATAEEIERLSGGSTFVLEDLGDPDLNIAYGTFYLRHLLDIYEDNEVAALAAYNAGPTRVSEWGGADLEIDDIPDPAVRAYVEQVLEKQEEYRDEYADDLGL